MLDAPERPLKGLRVLELVTGPMAAIGRLLADLGADVIRLEPPGGAEDRGQGLLVDDISLDFVSANFGKRASLLHHLDALVSGADILIESGESDVTSLREANPQLVILTVSDFGAVGRFARWAGSGPIFHALSGMLSRSGIPERAPLLPPGDIARGCAVFQGAYLVLLAYWNRLKSGLGDHLDFSTLDGAAQALDPGYGISGSATGGIAASQLPRGRDEARHRYPILACRDGYIRLCILAPRQWRHMFEWMGRPEEFSDPRYEDLNTRFNSKSLIRALSQFVAGKSRMELEEEGKRIGVPVAALLDLEEAMQTEHMVERQAFKTVELTPGIDAPFPNGVMEIDGVRMGISGPPPVLEDNLNWKEPRFVGQAPNRGERPLSGLRVLDLGVIVVGAEGGRLLSDFGADVVKIESAAFPDGSRQNQVGGLVSPTFVVGHRNKRSLGLNLRELEGKKLLLDLIAKSDVLLSNFKGGTLQSLGLDYKTLMSVNPRIIVTDSSAFGSTGSWSRRMGYGPLVRASAGVAVQWRYPDDPNSFSDGLTVYPDHAAGRIAAIGVLAMLMRRLRSGVGGAVSMSQAEIMLSHMAVPAAKLALEKTGHKVTGQAVEENSAVYQCRGDDEWCVVTIRGDQDMQAIENVTAGTSLAEWLKTQSPNAAMELLQTVGVPAGAMLRVSELPASEYYRERGLFRKSGHPHRPESYIEESAPVRSERLPNPPEKPAPLMGEQTSEIISEMLGLSDAEIDRLCTAGVLEPFKMAN